MDWTVDRQMYIRTISNVAVSQSLSNTTECIFPAVLDVEKSIFVFMFFVNLADAGTAQQKHHQCLVSVFKNYQSSAV